jgi:hypothetical protein
LQPTRPQGLSANLSLVNGNHGHDYFKAIVNITNIPMIKAIMSQK